MSNPLLSDKNTEFVLYEVLDTERLTGLEAFADHSRETFDLYLGSVKKLAREVLFPAYRAMDEAPPRLQDGRVVVHPALHQILPRMIELGVISATRPAEVGGQALPMCVATVANGYLMAGNLSAYGYIGLTTGAARLIESFGDSELRERFMTRMYAGEWTGTMALTEPQAGSSLSDVMTRATPTDQGYHLVQGSKIFISGGDQDVTENVVHLALARIDGAPLGIKGVSLFAIPNRREEAGKLVDNDVAVTGLIHKIGWRGLPSLALSYGEAGDCRGWLVGEPHRGIHHMFQMMNEARLMVGMNAAATASVAYLEALAYARERPQGRPLGNKDPRTPQVPIIEHPDVRRMLLRQKAIVEGALSLLVSCALYADLAEHSQQEAERQRAGKLLDLLTPVAKSFPAEKGYESNALSVQVHGGYGYSSEYLPEAWLRDQKLNSIHEGTTGIQAMDLLGRKVMGDGGQALMLLRDEMNEAIARARRANVPDGWCGRLEGAMAALATVSAQLGELAMQGEIERVLWHSTDYLELFGVVAVGWQWILQAAAAKEALARGATPSDFYQGKLRAAQYWVNDELPRAGYLSALCRGDDDSFGTMPPEQL